MMVRCSNDFSRIFIRRKRLKSPLRSLPGRVTNWTVNVAHIRIPCRARISHQLLPPAPIGRPVITTIQTRPSSSSTNRTLSTYCPIYCSARTICNPSYPTPFFSPHFPYHQSSDQDKTSHDPSPLLHSSPSTTRVIGITPAFCNSITSPASCACPTSTTLRSSFQNIAIKSPSKK